MILPNDLRKRGDVIARQEIAIIPIEASLPSSLYHFAGAGFIAIHHMSRHQLLEPSSISYKVISSGGGFISHFYAVRVSLVSQSRRRMLIHFSGQKYTSRAFRIRVLPYFHHAVTFMLI